MRTIFKAASIGTLALASYQLLAADHPFPVKPVRMVNPYAAGGGTDIVGRAVGQYLGESWGQPVVIDNRPGAGTTIGTEIVVRAVPDGYTLLLNNGSIATTAALYRDLSFSPVKDLAPVAAVVQSPYVLAIHPGVNAKSLPEFVHFARTRSGKVAYGSEGVGSAQFLTMELFKSIAQINLLHVPYKGGAPTITALAGGEVQAIFGRISNIMPLAKTGRLRALAITSGKRVDGIDVPTVAEQGYAGFEALTWYGVFAPARTPAAIINKINADINKSLQKSELRNRFLAQALFSMAGPPETLRDHLNSEIQRWSKVIADTGVKPE